MKRFACLGLLCFLFFPVAASCCNLAEMLKNSAHKDWEKIECLTQMGRYVEQARKTKRLTAQQRRVIRNASWKSAKRVQNLLIAGRVQDASDLSKIWQGIRTGDPISVIQYDRYGNVILPNPKTKKQKPYKNSRPDLAALDEEHERQRPENPLVLPGLSYEDAQTLFFGVKSKPEEMRLPLERLARAAHSGADLEPFIRILAERGSSDPSSPKYISSQFLQASFMYYAESLAASAKDKLTAYMNKKYEWRVRYAAALAAAAYSDRTLMPDGSYRMNDPAGKFFLTEDERALIRGLFAYAVAQNSQPRELLKYRFARVYAGDEEALFYAAAAGPDNPWALFSVTTPTAVVAFSAAEAAMLAASTQTLLVVGSVGILYYALDDAFSNSYRNNFTHSLDRALPDAPSFPVAEEYPQSYGNVEEGYQRLIEVAAVVRGQVGALTDASVSEETAQTCIYDPATRAKPEKWKLKELSSRLNDPADVNAARFYDCLAQAGFCPKSKGPNFSYCRPDRLDTHIRKQMSPVCQIEFDQIDKVMKDVGHFYNPNNRRMLAVRAVWWSGKWKTEAELPLRISGPIDWVRMLGSEFEHLPWWGSGAERGLRFGDHEMNTITEWNGTRYHHFHYMEVLPYKGAQTFVCNHMLFALDGEMEKYFGKL